MGVISDIVRSSARSENAPMLAAVLALAALNALLLVVLLLRRGDRGAAAMQQSLSESLRAGREESASAARQQREETAAGLASARDALEKSLSTSLGTIGELQRAQLTNVQTQLNELQQRVVKQMTDAADSNRAAIDAVGRRLDERAKELQQSNEKKLEEMRKTVDEKLQGTLERRLGESFKLVGDQLAAVHAGLGDMKKLAVDVGGLQRVLTNVKTRGTWAEVQLGTILEQILSPGQYEKNVRPREDSLESVEYAIRLPGPRNDPRRQVWLPIDSKFPLEDYQRLQDAAERGDAEGVAAAADALARRVREQANDVNSKYVCPPATTDFAILYLATEGLYAEVVRNPALADELHHRHRVVVAGPTTLAAILNALRMGFQTLAIEQRASEVWEVLAAVKTEFGKFGTVLDRVKKQLKSAANTIEQTGTRTRQMERKLRDVAALPESQTSRVLGLASGEDVAHGAVEPSDDGDDRASDSDELDEPESEMEAAAG
jgi:DNA recombination protein RmuC